MSKFMFTAQYSSASWARLVKGSDDRAAQVRSLMESLGGSLDQIYWSGHNSAVHVIAELPDALTAEAAVITVMKTGAFTSVKATQLLTQEEMSDTLVLTRSAQEFYEAPGKSAVEISY
jgi:uncharacterized protein with GYD domain